MSVGALVAQVGEVLGRGQELFGAPPVSGGLAATESGAVLASAGDLVRGARIQMSRQRGVLAADYAGFATDAGPALDAAGGADDGLAKNLHDAAGTDRSGHRRSGAVLTGAATDTAALAPSSSTAAGQRALVSALRARVIQQQRVIAACQTRDARLAGELRSLAHSRRAGRSGGSPIGAMPFGGSGFGSAAHGSGAAPAGWSGRNRLGGAGRDPRTTLASHVDRFPRDGDGRGGPGQGAAQAALSKLGRPYVWGAKGPSDFDCSGLTQWAWRQAGVALGGDTYAQLGNGIPVPAGQVRAGDLIFPLDAFGEGGRPGPGHVQLAISDTEVVHAPHTGDVVRVAPMPGRYVARRPVRSTLT